MTKTKKRRRNATSGAPEAAVPGGGLGDAGDRAAARKSGSGWAAVPGRRLDVDLADLADPDGRGAAPAGGGRFDVEKWTSRHYDYDDDDDDGDSGGGGGGVANGGGDEDLFDPDPGASSNKFDVGSKVEGAHDAGVFLSLEVIPADAYRVERTGDGEGGFLTRLVLPDDEGRVEAGGGAGDAAEGPSHNDKSKKKKTKKKKSKEGGGDRGETGAEQSTVEEAPAKEGGEAGEVAAAKERLKKERLERKKLKRKAKREMAKERKRLRREAEGSQNSSIAAPSPKATGESPEGSEIDEKGRSGSAETSDGADDGAARQAEIERLQTAWSIAAPGVTLHPTLCAGLHSMGYAHPTPIQSASLPAAILGRRDIVGAAPTGSGKTLSYGLPILQRLLEGDDPPEGVASEEGAAKEGGKGSAEGRRPLQALVLTPTRELALQVTAELSRVCGDQVKIGTIVGGFAEVKQRRTLERTRPPVLVGTPGRLWELMSSKEYGHLNNLAQLQFLVVDEADRLVKQGSFPQLRQIFDEINRANPPPEDEDSEDDGDSDSDSDDGRLRSLRGVRGEAKVVMLDDSILAAIERERSRGGGGGGDAPAPMEMDDDEYEEQRRTLEQEAGSENESEEPEPVHRQTFVYSATLTLPPSMHHLIKKDASALTKGRRRRRRHPATADGAIAEILDAAGARGETKVVDLSNAAAAAKPEGGKKGAKARKDNSKNNKDGSGGTPTPATRLPPGLALGEVPCAQRRKDSHLYAYLVATRQGSSGPCLVFCNSIAAVRRVGDTLRELGLPARTLHAQMAQKSRLGALESLRTPGSRSVVVCSDVAARGLDIPSVSTVVQYDVARAVDTFIHRAGRTARGIGEKAVGTSISLVAPAEEREHQKICEAVQGAGSKSLEQVHIDGRLLNEAQERVALATKIVACNDVESQASRKNKWLQDAAKEAGLEVDEDMMEGGLLDGDRRDRQRFLEAQRAKAELRRLLAKPMRKQHFGKFLSGAGLRESIKAENEVKPFVVKKLFSKGKNRRKKVPKNK